MYEPHSNQCLGADWPDLLDIQMYLLLKFTVPK
jgi:hypothetical protein